MPDYPLVPDPRAGFIVHGGDFVKYQQMLPELYLKPAVHAVVREHVEIVKRILTHSYFVYEFIDVAFMHLVIGLEKALKLRYLDLTGKDGEKKSLNYLIEWARQEGLFETFDTDILDLYRRVRNAKVHEPKNTLGGFAYLKKMVEPILFINDLYEDSTLRNSRKSFMREKQEAIGNLYKRGGTLTIANKVYLIDELYLAFYNNKHKEPVCTLFTSFVMMPLGRKFASISTKSFDLKSFSFNLESGIIKGVEALSNEDIQFDPLTDQTDIALVQNYRLGLLTDEENGVIKKFDVSLKLRALYLDLWLNLQKIG